MPLLPIFPAINYQFVLDISLTFTIWLLYFVSFTVIVTVSLCTDLRMVVHYGIIEVESFEVSK